MSDKKKYYATRDFNDAGTEQSFATGEPVDVPDGQILNYAAAGLVTDKAPAPAAKSADTSKDGGKTA